MLHRSRMALTAALVLATLVGAADTLCSAQSAATPTSGAQKRSLWVKEAQRDIPYRLHVPSRWAPGHHLPLVILFPGGGQDENAAFDQEPAELQGVVARTAEKHQFILLALGSQGTRLGAVFTIPQGMQQIVRNITPEANHVGELAAARIIDRVATDFGVNRARIYLMGNSMGEAVTLHFAQQDPGKWCAIAPSDGPFENPAFPFERLHYLSAARFIHGDHDTNALMEPNKAIAEKVRQAGVATEFVMVPGGTHRSAWYLALPDTFEFFDQHRCASQASRKQTAGSGS